MVPTVKADAGCSGEGFHDDGFRRLVASTSIIATVKVTAAMLCTSTVPTVKATMVTICGESYHVDQALRRDGFHMAPAVVRVMWR